MNKITTDWREATTGITREQALAAGFIEVKNRPNSFYCYEEANGMQLIEQLDHLDDEFDSPDVHLMPRLDMCNLPTMNKITTFEEYSRAAGV